MHESQSPQDAESPLGETYYTFTRLTPHDCCRSAKVYSVRPYGFYFTWTTPSVIQHGKEIAEGIAIYRELRVARDRQARPDCALISLAAVHLSSDCSQHILCAL